MVCICEFACVCLSFCDTLQTSKIYIYALGNSGQHNRVLWVWFTVRNKMWHRCSSSSRERDRRWGSQWFVDLLLILLFLFLCLRRRCCHCCHCIVLFLFVHTQILPWRQVLKEVEEIKNYYMYIEHWYCRGDSFDRRVRETIISSFNFSIWCDDVVVVCRTRMNNESVKKDDGQWKNRIKN